MKITETKPIKLITSKLEAFSNRQFTVQLSGFELLAIRLISGKIGGIGALRSVFSSCGKGNGQGFYEQIRKIEGASEAFEELEQYLDRHNEKTTDSNNSIILDDDLPIRE